MAPPSTYPLSLHDALPISVDDLEYVAGQIERMTADERDLRDRKVRGGAPFAPVIEGLNAAVAFHHPELDEAADLAGQWAEACDLDGPAAAALGRAGLVDPGDRRGALAWALGCGDRWL